MWARGRRMSTTFPERWKYREFHHRGSEAVRRKAGRYAPEFLTASLPLWLAYFAAPYGSASVTRRLRGSRTPSGVGTAGSDLPCQASATALLATPSLASSARTASARRLESAMLYFCVPARSV